jgi:hypothetical protein
VSSHWTADASADELLRFNVVYFGTDSNAYTASLFPVFLAYGEDKAEALKSIFLKPFDPKQFPVPMISHHGRKVTWFFDQTAARLLN